MLEGDPFDRNYPAKNSILGFHMAIGDLGRPDQLICANSPWTMGHPGYKIYLLGAPLGAPRGEVRKILLPDECFPGDRGRSMHFEF